MRKRIKVDYLSRVEGEGGIRIEIKDREIQCLNLKIFEAPRFFEPLLRGRTYQDVIDFTARVCGICPVAYQMSAVHAIESVLGIEVDESIRRLRRLLYSAEWIESHALHVYLLHGPDFYGLDSAWASKDYLPHIKRGLMLKRLGNEILTLIGGRSIHPVSVRAGGFFRVPRKNDLQAILSSIKTGYEESLKGIRWAVSLFELKDTHSERDERCRANEYVSLKDPEGYPMNRGMVVTSVGREFTMEEFFDSLEEYQVSHSTALHSGIKDDNQRVVYMVGPLSRLNLNSDLLPEDIKTVIKDTGVTLPLTDINKSIIARSIEIALAFSEAIRIIEEYKEPRPFVETEPKEGMATWITEAPRGLLIHSYEFDRHGLVQKAKLITPTSQNLAHVEKTLYNFVTENIEKPVDLLRKACEQIIRSYDPCISCSVHIVNPVNDR